MRADQLSLNGEAIRTTEKEFRLALLFFRHLGKPLSRAFILESVWPENAEFSSRSMDTHVSRVRTKLGLQPARGFRLAPVYSYGYRLEQIKGWAEAE
jgi:DNA-binding response OmpR family regulator